jgi:hypothetical protein
LGWLVGWLVVGLVVGGFWLVIFGRLVVWLVAVAVVYHVLCTTAI